MKVVLYRIKLLNKFYVELKNSYLGITTKLQNAKNKEKIIKEAQKKKVKE